MIADRLGSILGSMPVEVRTYWQQHPEQLERAFRQLLGSQSINEVDLYTKLLNQQRPDRRWLVWTNNNPPLVTNIAHLRLVPILKNPSHDESLSSGDLFNRATQLDAMFGVAQAHWLLTQQQDIPAEWQPFAIFFPGAVWQEATDPDQGLILRLQCLSGRWIADGYYTSLLERNYGTGWINDRFLTVAP